MRNYEYQPSGTVDRARGLRRNATHAEKRLWRALREQLPHAKFRRQVPHGPYFADFLSFAAKLIVEVDGGQHAEATQYDSARTRYLEAQGYRVVRFWNNEVLENMDGVLTVIAGHLPLSLRERGQAAQRRGGGEGDHPSRPQSPSPSPSHRVAAGPSLSRREREVTE